jgi:hypothetical protein
MISQKVKEEIKEDIRLCHVIVVEVVLILLAAASIGTSMDGYLSLLHSSSDVQAILNNWNTGKMLYLSFFSVSAASSSQLGIS